MKAALLAVLLADAACGNPTLPVFLADNHAESFGWIAGNLDLDAEAVLVLTDAHSDASAAERSEEIREGLRRVVSEKQRAERIEAWRTEGRIQAFNWIEPLMPRPFGQVFWVAPDGDFEAMREKAGRQCDGRLEVEPRSSGELAGRWQVGGIREMEGWNPGSRPVVWSLDLDYFAGMPAARAAEEFERMWIAAMDWPGLRAVTVAVSRPWLTSDAEAERLVSMALSAVMRTRGAVLEIDATVDDRPDASLKSREGEVHRWDLAKASPEVGAWISGLGDRCRVTDRRRSHRFPQSPVQLVVDGAGQDLDGVWRVPAGEKVVIRLVGSDGTGRVRWFPLAAARVAYDRVPETGLGKGFSRGAGRWIYEKRSAAGETTDFAWQGAVSSRMRLEALHEKDGRWLPAGIIELATEGGGDFRRELQASMGMPYVFGIAEVKEGGRSGVESGWGADCSNVLIAAWRRCGETLTWGDPEALRRQMVPVSGAVDEEDLARGVMIDFGSHVAALMEDREPVGTVGPGDRVFHQLGGTAEIVDLAELQQGRPDFRLWTLPERKTVAVRVAGDVVPVGEFAAIDGFEKGPARLFLANLEGVPTDLPAVGDGRYDFRFPLVRLAWLREWGIDAVSLANNHAGDAGREGLIDALANLERAGIGVFGAGRDEGEACRPWRREGIACFGVSIVTAMEAGKASPGVASLPRHAGRLEREMAEARERGETIVVLLHGGDEYVAEVNEEQRHWSRWLVARGARLVAGAGPHVVQREERFAGAVVAHSLGNAVFPKGLKGMDSGRVGEWKVVSRGR
ncbi:CapA family protein [Haloferula sargassicola]|uniref:Capsule synthesis protein CapA domain-containing protein n=1 Tax=Haloferula sargassicola TaxID=490096 RepID=A0ABP9URF5_9BACT